MPDFSIYKASVDRKITVILGYPFYQSSGINSGYKDTWFPFNGVQEAVVATDSLGITKKCGWIVKPKLLPYEKKFFDTLHDSSVDSHFFARFGGIDCICISYLIGGGFWKTPEGQITARLLKKSYADFIQKLEIKIKLHFAGAQRVSAVFDCQTKEAEQINSLNRWLMARSDRKRMTLDTQGRLTPLISREADTVCLAPMNNVIVYNRLYSAHRHERAAKIQGSLKYIFDYSADNDYLRVVSESKRPLEALKEKLIYAATSYSEDLEQIQREVFATHVKIKTAVALQKIGDLIRLLTEDRSATFSKEPSYPHTTTTLMPMVFLKALNELVFTERKLTIETVGQQAYGAYTDSDQTLHIFCEDSEYPVTKTAFLANVREQCFAELRSMVAIFEQQKFALSDREKRAEWENHITLLNADIRNAANLQRLSELYETITKSRINLFAGLSPKQTLPEKKPLTLKPLSVSDSSGQRLFQTNRREEPRRVMHSRTVLRPLVM